MRTGFRHTRHIDIEPRDRVFPPRERLARAVVSGVRYILNSPSIRVVLARTFITGVAGGSVSALMPLVARLGDEGAVRLCMITMGAAVAVVALSSHALLGSAAALLASALLGFWLRLPRPVQPNERVFDPLAGPEVRLPLTPRSGPIVVEIEYVVDPNRARHRFPHRP